MGKISFFLKTTIYRIQSGLKTFFIFKNPPKIFLASVFSDQTKIIKVELKNGFSFFTRKLFWDFFVLSEVMAKKEYAIIENDLPSPKTIIDVGAHIGSFSVFYGKKFESAKILCFEPMPQSFELLKKNIEENGLQEQVIPFNAAVVGKKTAKQIPLYICEDNPACNSLYKEHSQKGSKETFVKTLTLSKIFSMNNITECDLLKLDCENAELEILRESKKELQKTRSIVLEYHDHKKFEEIKKLLHQDGFDLKKVPDTIIAYAKRN